VALQKEGALAQKLVDDAKVAFGRHDPTHPFKRERRTFGGLWVDLQGVLHEKEDHKYLEFLGRKMPEG